jgi:hypothetical protein
MTVDWHGREFTVAAWQVQTEDQQSLNTNEICHHLLRLPVVISIRTRNDIDHERVKQILAKKPELCHKSSPLQACSWRIADTE